MIFPGHVAASALCGRYLRLPLPLVLAAGLAPDVIDKVCFYLLRIVPSSRMPSHTLVGWLVTSAVLALAGWLWTRSWRWGLAWCVGFGAHLLCDSSLAGGALPLLYPWREYQLASYPFPLAFLWGESDWPLHTLLSELALTGAALWLLRPRRHPGNHPRRAWAPDAPSGQNPDHAR